MRLQVTIKTAKMLPKTDQSSDTSIKSSGNTLFHIYFASNSSVTTLLFDSASCCLAHLRPVFIFQFNYIRSAIAGSSQSTNLS